MKKTIIMILFTAAMISAQEFTLQKAIETGLSSSKYLNIYKAKSASADAEVKEISAGFYPRITAGFAYSRLSDIPPFEITTPFLPNPIKIQDPILNAYILRAGFQLPVFLGFKLTSLRAAARLQSQAAQKDFSTEVNNETMKITEAYWNYYKALESVRLLEKSLESMKKHLKDAENYFNVGMIQRNEILKIELETKNLESSLIDAKNKVNFARTIFNKTIGVSLTEKSMVVLDDRNDEFEKYDLEKLLEEAVKKRAELSAAELRKNAVEKSLSSAKSGYFPSLSLFGNYYYNRPNQRILPLEDKFADTWEVGVSVNWTVFDWGKTSAQVTKAEQSLIEISNKVELLKENIQTEVIKNYTDYTSALFKIEAQKTALESAKENLKVTQDLFAQQMISAAYLTDAETQLLKSETELLFAKISARLSQTRLLKSIGRKIY